MTTDVDELDDEDSDCDDGRASKFNPTPEQIEERAAEVRAGWQGSTRRRRMAEATPRVEMLNFNFDRRWNGEEIV